ncbi:hypothetical protein [Variovorax sp. W6]|uniref:hypothetical protein n=1 Tax=Variovorax sp. W6 TaxID=3093895 RepID=UPI003D805B2D
MTKHLRARCLGGLVLLLPLLAHAAGTVDVPKGVWEGTLGTKAIVACFNSDYPSGSYFYKQYKKAIALGRSDKDSFWREGGETGLWALDPVKGTTLSGTWKSVKGTPTTLPIQLNLTDATGGDKACASDGYAGQLEAPPKIEIGKKEEYATGRSFRRLRFAGQETIELSGPEPTLAAINRELRRDFDTGQETVKEYFDKRRQFLGQVGVPAEDENTADPSYWTSQWLSIRNYTWAAGTGRAGISWFYRTWDLQTGKQVDPWSWFGPRPQPQPQKAPGQIAGTESGPMPPKLRRFLFKYAGIQPSKAEENCKSNYDEGAHYDLTLEAKGMRFSQPEYGTGCEIAIEVPYADLAPVLTPAGKAAVRRILESAK